MSIKTRQIQWFIILLFRCNRDRQDTTPMHSAKQADCLRGSLYMLKNASHIGSKDSGVIPNRYFPYS